jgi:transposase InsO family protein
MELEALKEKSTGVAAMTKQYAEGGKQDDSITLVHQRLGHIGISTLRRMQQRHLIEAGEWKGDKETRVTCEACQVGKASRVPFPHASQTAATKPLELVSLDLWGPVRDSSVGDGSRYVLSLIDHATRMVWSYPLVNKESMQIRNKLENWRLQVERQTDVKVKCIRSDNGAEFKGEVSKWILQLGITRQLSAPCSPQQNGMIERWHRTMAEGIRTQLLHSGLPTSFWAEALRHVVWVNNFAPHNGLKGGLTPFEAWWGRKPDLSMARVWGAMGCVKATPHELQAHGKLRAKGVMCVCLGVDDETKGWRMLDPNLLRVRVTRDVEFMESLLWTKWAEDKKNLLVSVAPPEVVLHLLPTPTETKVTMQEVIPLRQGDSKPTREVMEEAVHQEPTQRLQEIREDSEVQEITPPKVIRQGPVTRSMAKQARDAAAMEALRLSPCLMVCWGMEVEIGVMPSIRMRSGVTGKA